MRKGEFIFVIIGAFVILFVVILSFFAFSYFNKQKSEQMPETCNENNSCVKIQTTCCACSSGGQEACVPKDKVEEYQKNLESCPKDLICAQVYNCKNIICTCANSTCTAG